MNKIQSMLAICVILAIIGISMWNMPNIEQNQNLNEITNNTVNQSNVIPLEKPPFLNENTP